MKIMVVGRVIKEATKFSVNMHYAVVRLPNKSLLEIFSDNRNTFTSLVYIFKINYLVAIELEIKNATDELGRRFVYHALIKAEIIKKIRNKNLTEEDINETLALSPHYIV